MRGREVRNMQVQDDGFAGQDIARHRAFHGRAVRNAATGGDSLDDGLGLAASPEATAEVAAGMGVACTQGPMVYRRVFARAAVTFFLACSALLAPLARAGSDPAGGRGSTSPPPLPP